MDVQEAAEAEEEKKKHKMRKIHFSSDSVATDQHLPYF